ncbi:MAG: ABC transporter ATP-binding protein [Bacteroidetes bacterium]|nr:ABC transporter ATP-binding protein [Bacteroidota bacterium]
MPTLELADLATGYSRAGNTMMLHSRMNWTAESGELVLLAGRNGAGKTTLMRTLCGLHEPASGKVLIQGSDLHALSSEARAACVSLLMSSAPSMPLTRAIEVVLTGRHRMLNPWTLDESNHLDLCLKCMKTVGVGHLQNREFSKLSDGEKQKVMLARCLAQETPLLLLDEPLAFLDYPSRRELLQLFRQLCTGAGKCIVYSSHDLELALQYADHLLFLADEGKWQWISGKEQIAAIAAASLFAS